MTDVESPAALYERRGNVALITINRPEARNAVNGAVSTAVSNGMFWVVRVWRPGPNTS